MAETHVLTALYSKYALAMGELRKLETNADKHRADLEHIEATIRLFKPIEFRGHEFRGHYTK